MGRLPCSDKVGMKKGPWTPEEDILLVSYVQENGPANWRAVPTNTGLKRCSKSCRLRWTNYLRPGIKRGTFTDHEEKMIIQLQALLGNKWAAIASYLPQRTDNDIKNYWNTHLVKKLKKLSNETLSNTTTTTTHSISKGKWERRLQTDINTAKQALKDALSIQENSCSLSNFLNNFNDKPTPSSTYASSTENIARLLKGWVKNTPNYEDSKSSSCSGDIDLFVLDQSFTNSDDLSRSTSPSIVNGDTKPRPTEFGPLSVLEEWLLDNDDHGESCFENLSFDGDGNLNLF